MTRYLRPTGFGDGLPLAGGWVRFARVEVIEREAGRTRREVVDAERLDAAELARLTAPRAPLALAGGPMTFDTPRVMGILNVTPDSFSDGGRNLAPEAAAAAARAQRAAGADIVDIGGESTRPGAATVPLEVELGRVGPVLAALGGEALPISIDTRKAAVMSAALDAGAGLVNDVSALTHDPDALALVAARGCPVVLMHAQGDPATMQVAPAYDNVLLDVYDWLAARIAACVAAGIAREAILIDPGIGFGKTVAHNLALLSGLALFHGLGAPIVLGVSRKRMIAALGGAGEANARLGGSLALALAGLAQGAQLVRVHDVGATVEAVRCWLAVQRH